VMVTCDALDAHRSGFLRLPSCDDATLGPPL